MGSHLCILDYGYRPNLIPRLCYRLAAHAALATFLGEIPLAGYSMTASVSISTWKKADNPIELLQDEPGVYRCRCSISAVCWVWVRSFGVFGICLCCFTLISEQNERILRAKESKLYNLLGCCGQAELLISLTLTVRKLEYIKQIQSTRASHVQPTCYTITNATFVICKEVK